MPALSGEGASEHNDPGTREGGAFIDDAGNRLVVQIGRTTRGLLGVRRWFMGDITAQRRADVIVELDGAGSLNPDYLLLVVLSCLIATLGLVLNSGPVTIGAMLIAPLMSPILTISLSLVRGDLIRFGRALSTLVAGIAMAIAMSALLAGAVDRSQFHGFLAEMPVEVLNRTEPTLFDLIVALAGGFLASYALAQPRLSPTLPGVAIATSLMPPLCVVGIGISQRDTAAWNGALLLFLANFVAIIFSSALVFVMAGFGPLALHQRRQVLSRTFAIASVSLVLVTIPLANFMVRIADDAQTNQTIRTILAEELTGINPDAELVEFDRLERGDRLHVLATVRMPQNLTQAESVRIQRALASRMDSTVSLELLVVPVTRLDPLAPQSPDAADMLSVEKPLSTTTAAPARTTTPIVDPSPTPSPSPTPPPTSAPSPTPEPTVTPSESRTSTLLGASYASVGATGDEGVNFRLEPGLNTALIESLADATVVELTGAQADLDGLTWLEVVSPSGQVGWIAEKYLVPYDSYDEP